MKDEIPIMLNESYARSYQMAYDFIKRHARATDWKERGQKR